MLGAEGPSDAVEPPTTVRRASSGGTPMGAPGEGAVRGWDTYATDEAEAVLAEFPIGKIERAQEYRRGSRSAPKLKIKTATGTYLLKRRSIARHPVARIQFAQRLQVVLDGQGFPVPGLVPLRETGETLLLVDEFAYELFRFVEGDRYDKSARGAARSGESLAKLHRMTRDMDLTGVPPASFHGSTVVRSALHRLSESIRAADPAADLDAVNALVAALRDMYERSCEEIDDLGFRRMTPGVVHGDWHPGNLIYRSGMVVAVIDFDSARTEPRATEIANGMLQFALRGEAGVSPLEWPNDLDAKRMQAFLHGYLAAADRPVTLDERTMLPWLMIEAMIAESSIPVANQGSFAELPGAAFMDLVHRKCEWTRQHRKAIAAL